MLADSAKIQEEDAAHINIARNYAEPWVQPLYTVTDVEKVFGRLVSVPYGRDVDATKTCAVPLHRGRARPRLRDGALDRCRARSANGTLGFSGDMGRRGLPILKPTGAIPPADVLVCESTYGNRAAPARFTETVEKLYAAIRETVDREGKVLIPAFSLGRTQLIIHVLQQGLRAAEDSEDSGVRRQPAGVGSGGSVPLAPE